MKMKVDKILVLALVLIIVFSLWAPTVTAKTITIGELPHQVFINNDFDYPSQPTGFTGPIQYKGAMHTGGIHDNVFEFDEHDNLWWTFQTGNTAAKTSTNLINWTSTTVTSGSNRWAPAICRLDMDGDGTKETFAHYSGSVGYASRWGQIDLRIAPRMSGPWTLVPGAVITTYEGDGLHVSPIDPDVFYDATGTKLYLIMGSYHGGIFVMEIDPSTGKAFDQATATGRCPATVSVIATNTT